MSCSTNQPRQPLAETTRFLDVRSDAVFLFFLKLSLTLIDHIFALGSGTPLLCLLARPYTHSSPVDHPFSFCSGRDTNKAPEVCKILDFCDSNLPPSPLLRLFLDLV